ncbi:Brp/Blh family beta-carotene 15,15'-dioxygenase [Croceivirga thetidis]|uniref:Probable beta-carotene 15,15'-dioxygenase n=1 Tax=Croceivirga thetidis TaxID=2721623 RepID=A0ABX1GVZ7_9FLAO|nr:Brp/Blh family beta-carotene 15,15'-dioxygenase [Croceivirga thetidis]NKI33186.1 beta-carotene 15,15'-dioxygenase, Brp/Blh family [Croceivirga thetidis]
MKNWLIVITFFSLWLSTQFSEQVQDYMAYGLILTFGVLHGANDIFIASRLKSKNQRIRKILLPYIVVVILVSLLFLVSKSLALLFFVCISAYHFGEQHFKSNLVKELWWEIILFFAYGFSILFMIFYLRINEVSSIIYEITSLTLSPKVYLVVFVMSLGVFLILFTVMVKNRLLRVDVFRELFMFVVFAIVFKTASLSWAFAIYFIFWHSIPSLNDQMVFLYGNSDRLSILKYLKTSWLYWGISILGLAILYFILREKVDYFITILLYVLAAITFPHVIVMSKVENAKNSP